MISNIIGRALIKPAVEAPHSSWTSEPSMFSGEEEQKQKMAWRKNRVPLKVPVSLYWAKVMQLKGCGRGSQVLLRVPASDINPLWYSDSTSGRVLFFIYSIILNMQSGVGGLSMRPWFVPEIDGPL